MGFFDIFVPAPSIELYKTDYVLIDDEGEPMEELDVIYSHEAIVDLINMGNVFMLTNGERLVSMTDLPADLQARYLQDIVRRRDA